MMSTSWSLTSLLQTPWEKKVQLFTVFTATDLKQCDSCEKTKLRQILGSLGPHMPSSKGPVVDSPARTRNHAVTNQGSDICLLQSSWKSLDIYPLADFVVKVSMAGTPYATQTFVSNFWCNFLSRKRKHARNLEQHHILFKELLKHCAARAWHLVPLGKLCPPTSFAKKEHPPKKQATQTGRGRIYGHELSKVPGRLSSPTGTTDLCVRRTPSSNGTPPTSPGHQ